MLGGAAYVADGHVGGEQEERGQCRGEQGGSRRRAPSDRTRTRRRQERHQLRMLEPNHGLEAARHWRFGVGCGEGGPSRWGSAALGRCGGRWGPTGRGRRRRRMQRMRRRVERSNQMQCAELEPHEEGQGGTEPRKVSWGPNGPHAAHRRVHAPVTSPPCTRGCTPLPCTLGFELRVQRRSYHLTLLDVS